MKLLTYLFIVVFLVLVAVVLKLTITQEPELLFYRLPMYITVYMLCGLHPKFRTLYAAVTSCVVVAAIETINIIWGDGQLFRVSIVILYCGLTFLVYNNAVKILKSRC